MDNRPRRKRKYNTAFLNQPKEVNEGGDEPPTKKYKSSTRKSLEKITKYEFIKYLHDHQELTAIECKNQDQWKRKIQQKDNTVQKWRTEYGVNTEKYKNLQKYAIQNKNKGGKKKRRSSINPEIIKYGSFPTLEKEILNQREERVKKCRDKSMVWMTRAIEKLLANPDKLDSLDLTPFESNNIHRFKGSEGWCRKVMVFVFI